MSPHFQVTFPLPRELRDITISKRFIPQLGAFECLYILRIYHPTSEILGKCFVPHRLDHIREVEENSRFTIATKTNYLKSALFIIYLTDREKHQTF